jgi:hypothetical protein
MAGVDTLGVVGLDATLASRAVAPVVGLRFILCSDADESWRATDGGPAEGVRGPWMAADLKDCDLPALDIFNERLLSSMWTCSREDVRCEYHLQSRRLSRIEEVELNKSE